MKFHHNITATFFSPTQTNNRTNQLSVFSLRNAFLWASLLSACSPPIRSDAGVDVADAFVCLSGQTAPDAACPIRRQNYSACMDLTIGSGKDGTTEDFRPLNPGDALFVTPGNQGLQHLVVAIRGRDFSPDLPLIELRAVRSDNCNEVGYTRFRLPFEVAANGERILTAQRIVLLDPDPLEYCTILDKDVTILADINDGQGRSAHREIQIHVSGIDPTIDPRTRQAWENACRPDGGVTQDATTDASDSMAIDSNPG